jgi:F0F1-type ATP synthase assembly protein I
MGMMVIGSEMASFTIAGLLIDWAAGTMPWFTIGMTLFGFVGSFFQLMQIARRLNAPPAEQPRNPP